MALLTPETVPAYVASKLHTTPFSSAEGLSAVEISGGNLNYAFQVTNGEQSVFVKQAPDFIKVFGPEAKLYKERMALEVSVYRDFAAALGESDAAKYLPKIYDFDEDNMAFIMEFLGDLELLDKVMVKEDFGGLEQCSLESGRFMAKVHAATHSTVVAAERAKELHAKYENKGAPLRPLPCPSPLLWTFFSCCGCGFGSQCSVTCSWHTSSQNATRRAARGRLARRTKTLWQRWKSSKRLTAASKRATEHSVTEISTQAADPQTTPQRSRYRFRCYSSHCPFASLFRKLDGERGHRCRQGD